MTALSIGAFALTADGGRTREIGASVSLGDAKLQTDRSASLLRSAGDFDSCSNSTAETPNGNCASPVQVFLVPLPGRAADEGPPEHGQGRLRLGQSVRALGRLRR